jgi:hypothetical protein
MKFLSDDMCQIIEHLRKGARLIGPVTVSRATGHGDRPWGFSDGRRANKISVDALAARGLILIREDGGAREARLAQEADGLFGVKPSPEPLVA